MSILNTIGATNYTSLICKTPITSTGFNFTFEQGYADYYHTVTDITSYIIFDYIDDLNFKAIRLDPINGYIRCFVRVYVDGSYIESADATTTRLFYTGSGSQSPAQTYVFTQAGYGMRMSLEMDYSTTNGPIGVLKAWARNPYLEFDLPYIHTVDVWALCEGLGHTPTVADTKVGLVTFLTTNSSQELYSTGYYAWENVGYIRSLNLEQITPGASILLDACSLSCECIVPPLDYFGITHHAEVSVNSTLDVNLIGSLKDPEYLTHVGSNLAYTTSFHQDYTSLTPDGNGIYRIPQDAYLLFFRTGIENAKASQSDWLCPSLQYQIYENDALVYTSSTSSSIYDAKLTGTYLATGATTSSVDRSSASYDGIFTTQPRFTSTGVQSRVSQDFTTSKKIGTRVCQFVGPRLIFRDPGDSSGSHMKYNTFYIPAADSPLGTNDYLFSSGYITSVSAWDEDDNYWVVTVYDTGSSWELVTVKITPTEILALNGAYTSVAVTNVNVDNVTRQGTLTTSSIGYIIPFSSGNLLIALSNGNYWHYSTNSGVAWTSIATPQSFLSYTSSNSMLYYGRGIYIKDGVSGKMRFHWAASYSTLLYYVEDGSLSDLSVIPYITLPSIPGLYEARPTVQLGWTDASRETAIAFNAWSEDVRYSTINYSGAFTQQILSNYNNVISGLADTGQISLARIHITDPNDDRIGFVKYEISGSSLIATTGFFGTKFSKYAAPVTRPVVYTLYNLTTYDVQLCLPVLDSETHCLFLGALSESFTLYSKSYPAANLYHPGAGPYPKEIVTGIVPDYQNFDSYGADCPDSNQRPMTTIAYNEQAEFLSRLCCENIKAGSIYTVKLTNPSFSTYATTSLYYSNSRVALSTGGSSPFLVFNEQHNFRENFFENQYRSGFDPEYYQFSQNWLNDNTYTSVPLTNSPSNVYSFTNSTVGTYRENGHSMYFKNVNMRLRVSTKNSSAYVYSEGTNNYLVFGYTNILGNLAYLNLDVGSDITDTTIYSGPVTCAVRVQGTAASLQGSVLNSIYLFHIDGVSTHKSYSASTLHPDEIVLTFALDKEGASLKGIASINAVGSYVALEKLGATTLACTSDYYIVGSYANAYIFGATIRPCNAYVAFAPIVGNTKTATVALDCTSSCTASGESYQIVVTAFRFKNDDGDDTTATWASALNQPITNLQPNKTYRVRFAVTNNDPVYTRYFAPTALMHNVADSGYHPSGTFGDVVYAPRYEWVIKQQDILINSSLLNSPSLQANYMWIVDVPLHNQEYSVGGVYLQDFPTTTWKHGIFAGNASYGDTPINAYHLEDATFNTNASVTMSSLQTYYDEESAKHYMWLCYREYYILAGYMNMRGLSSSNHGASWTVNTDVDGSLLTPPSAYNDPDYFGILNKAEQYYDPNYSGSGDGNMIWTCARAQVNDNNNDIAIVFSSNDNFGTQRTYTTFGYEGGTSYSSQRSPLQSKRIGDLYLSQVTAHYKSLSKTAYTYGKIFFMDQPASDAGHIPYFLTYNYGQHTDQQFTTQEYGYAFRSCADVLPRNSNFECYVGAQANSVPESSSNTDHDDAYHYQMASVALLRVPTGYSDLSYTSVREKIVPVMDGDYWESRESSNDFDYCMDIAGRIINSKGLATNQGNIRYPYGGDNAEINTTNISVSSQKITYSDSTNEVLCAEVQEDTWYYDILTLKNSSEMYLDPSDGDLGFGFFSTTQQISTGSFDATNSFVSVDTAGPTSGIAIPPQTTIEIEFSFRVKDENEDKTGNDYYSITQQDTLTLKPIIVGFEENIDFITMPNTGYSPPNVSLSIECNVSVIGKTDSGYATLDCLCEIYAFGRFPPIQGAVNLLVEGNVIPKSGINTNGAVQMSGRLLLQANAIRTAYFTTALDCSLNMEADALCLVYGASSHELTLDMTATGSIDVYAKTALRTNGYVSAFGRRDVTATASLTCRTNAYNKGNIGWKGEVTAEGIDLNIYACKPELTIVKDKPLKLVQNVPEISIKKCPNSVKISQKQLELDIFGMCKAS